MPLLSQYVSSARCTRAPTEYIRYTGAAAAFLCAREYQHSGTASRSARISSVFVHCPPFHLPLLLLLQAEKKSLVSSSRPSLHTPSYTYHSLPFKSPSPSLCHLPCTALTDAQLPHSFAYTRFIFWPSPLVSRPLSSSQTLLVSYIDNTRQQIFGPVQPSLDPPPCIAFDAP